MTGMREALRRGPQSQSQAGWGCGLSHCTAAHILAVLAPAEPVARRHDVLHEVDAQRRHDDVEVAQVRVLLQRHFLLEGLDEQFEEVGT